MCRHVVVHCLLRIRVQLRIHSSPHAPSRQRHSSALGCPRWLRPGFSFFSATIFSPSPADPGTPLLTYLFLRPLCPFRRSSPTLPHGPARLTRTLRPTPASPSCLRARTSCNPPALLTLVRLRPVSARPPTPSSGAKKASSAGKQPVPSSGCTQRSMALAANASHFRCTGRF